MGAHHETGWWIWDAIYIAAGAAAFTGLLVILITEKDAAIRAVYREYRKQWTWDPLDAVRTDKRLPYESFRTIFEIAVAFFSIVLITAGIIQLMSGN